MPGTDDPRLTIYRPKGYNKVWLLLTADAYSAASGIAHAEDLHSGAEAFVPDPELQRRLTAGTFIFVRGGRYVREIEAQRYHGTLDTLNAVTSMCQVVRLERITHVPFQSPDTHAEDARKGYGYNEELWFAFLREVTTGWKAYRKMMEQPVDPD